VRDDVDAALVEESNHERAALHDVSVTERLLLDANVVEVGAVCTAEVFDNETAILLTELRVSTRHHSVIRSNRAFETAADKDSLGQRQLDRSLPALAVPENQACH
jgi:hypothetical protein